MKKPIDDLSTIKDGAANAHSLTEGINESIEGNTEEVGRQKKDSTGTKRNILKTDGDASTDKAAGEVKSEKTEKAKKSPPKQLQGKKSSDNKKSKAAKANTGEKTKKKGLSFKTISGLLFAKMMRGGASELRANVEKVNKLNVFPVPDGDTGDNMSMTIDSGVAAIQHIESDDLAQVMSVAAKGMLMGARGNSGVILSQFFAGIADKLGTTEKADAITMVNALEAGVERAYASVVTPTEGTILTVARESVEYAKLRITPKSTVKSLFQDLVKEMYDAVGRTPERLKVLKEAGVVDSGGAGLFFIIDGLSRVLGGEEIGDGQTKSPSAPTDLYEAFGPDSEMTFGYCTELLVRLQRSKCDIEGFDIDGLRGFLTSLGDSVVAIRSDSLVKLHVHTMNPERVLSHCHGFGEFINIKIENMSVQHTALENDEAANTKENAAPVSKILKKNGVVAVSSGDGISAVFKELMADEIVNGGQCNNPSTGDFIDAFKKVLAENIFVLPNNSNIMMAASQAAEIYTDARVYVIAAKTVGQGYVALSTMDMECQSPDEIMEAANEAIKGVSSAYLSPSVRDTEIGGVKVKLGDYIGVIDGELRVSLPILREATERLVDELLGDGSRFMITVFCGKDAAQEQRDEIGELIRRKYPETECYIIGGEQDIYPFIFVAE